jgi:D-lyxose ketol-isomerase
MKRSTINQIIREGDAFIRSFGYVMPPFAYYAPDEMKARATFDSTMIRDHMLGWDITDYGQGKFDELGLFLFTVRNGSAASVKTGMGMLYAEKIMISRQDQISPMHRHNLKTEDIINKGGATLALELFKAASDGSIDDQAEVSVRTDGRMRILCCATAAPFSGFG